MRRIQPKQWYADLGITYKTYVKRSAAPGTFKADEMIALAAAIEIEPGVIFALIQKAVLRKKGKKL
ncbi:MAG TPA: hypothetical protein VL832_28275 [Puia sp.]|nr:hypothetical protein [Puia sp.]